MAIADKPAHGKPGPKPTESVRRKVLEVALRIFADAGYDGASVREIARQSGVNHAMIKYYFDTKEALWREAVTFLFDRANAALEKNIDLKKAARGTEAALKEIVHSLVIYSARHPEHGRLIMRESIGAGPRLEWLSKKSEGHHDALWQLLSHAGCEIGRYDPRFIALTYALNSVCQTPFVLSREAQTIYGIELTHKSFRSGYEELVLDLVPALSRFLIHQTSRQ